MSQYYLSYLQEFAVFAVVVILVARSLRRTRAAKSEAKRIHGRYVFWWSMGAFVLGGLAAPLIGADLPNGAVGFAGFCLLAGWLVGTIHGSAALAGCGLPPTS